MELNNETKIGLTFGQILTLIGMIAFFVMGYANLNIRMSVYEQKQQSLELSVSSNEKMIETVRIENRDDHKVMFTKFDLILSNQRKNN